MPIYEYQCQQCGHLCEFIQKSNDPAITECPKCNNQQLKKMISATRFQLKGTGWYETDFKSKSTKENETSPTTAKEEKKTGKDKTDKLDKN